MASGLSSSTWAWTSFTPSYANVTVGNGSNVGWYTQVGKLVIVKVQFVMGTTSSITGTPTLTLPVTSSSNAMTNANTLIGQAFITDSGVNAFLAAARWRSTTTADLVVWGSASTYANVTGVSGTVPMTWGTSDEFDVCLMYEAA